MGNGVEEHQESEVGDARSLRRCVPTFSRLAKRVRGFLGFERRIEARQLRFVLDT